MSGGIEDHQLDLGIDTSAPDEIAYGEPGAPPFMSPSFFDGANNPVPRRAEGLDTDAQRAWFGDVTTWTEWLIDTFRLTKWFPPCWRAHPALVEEAQALFVGWGAAWLPGMDPAAPLGFLRDLDGSLARIENRWQIPCRQGEHTELGQSPPSEPHTERIARWWSNHEFNGFSW